MLGDKSRSFRKYAGHINSKFNSAAFVIY
ncbi:uncharacterized protein METZ01_LOCUS412194, partial [marine metagenome]